ncbi:MAG: hypothetical protein GPJ51_00020 [Candidatus Heimdallarchaeota archaeon]|nr:hypothetical protein [Candidatus Heimdallarchaeota archaeon]
MLNQSRLKVLKKLQSFRYPSVAESMIRERMERIEYSKNYEDESHAHFCYKRLQQYAINILRLKEIREKLEQERKLVLPISPNDTEGEIIERIREIKNNVQTKESKIEAKVSLPKTDVEIKKLVDEISLYFSQGYEMYKTSIDADISTSPIIEYYAILQIIKAIILLELEVDTREFLSAHGLERKKIVSNNTIFQVKAKTHGVFAALLLRTTSLKIEEDGTLTSELHKYYTNYYPKFEDFVDKQLPYFRIPESFIFLWILSEIARYQPKKWREICSGVKNNWIDNIDLFREEGVPKLFFDLINYHCN